MNVFVKTNKILLYTPKSRGALTMIEYITTHEAADKWGITARRVQLLCAQGRIEGAVKKASVWLIPQDAEKPLDGRAGRKATRKKDDNVLNGGIDCERHY